MLTGAKVTSVLTAIAFVICQGLWRMKLPNLFLRVSQIGIAMSVLANQNIHNTEAKIHRLSEGRSAPPEFNYKLTELIDKSDKFPIKFPISTTKTKSVLSRYASKISDQKYEEIEKQMLKNWKDSYPIIHEKVITLCIDFLEFKSKHGSSIEQKFYKNLGLTEFLTRLLSNRAVEFVGGGDSYQLLSSDFGRGNWETIGMDEEITPLVLKDYLSYDEIKIAALVVASSPSYFINKGDRHNRGVVGKGGDFQKWGIDLGAVGCRFERKNVMEWQEMLITPEQNTEEAGYGQQLPQGGVTVDGISKKRAFIQMWGKFYDQSFLPSWNEIDATKLDPNIRRIRRGAYLNTEIYKNRIRMSAETILLEANERGLKEDRKAFVHIVGLGLGVWGIADFQGEIFLTGFAETMYNLKLPFVSDVYFSWFSQNAIDGKSDGDKIGDVTIHFGKRDPHEKLVGDFSDRLLVCTYAWDGNALPGNEFWGGSLTASGDPAEACSSQIAELQNPHINPMMTGSNYRIASPTQGKILTLDEYIHEILDQSGSVVTNVEKQSGIKSSL